MTLTVGGIVLCGGKSQRMGQPKALLPFGGEPMLYRVVRILGEVVQPVVAVAAPGQELPALPPDVQLVRDERQGRGPLEGLAAGLRCLQDNGVDAAYASSTDVPFLTTQFITAVLSRLGDADIAVPHIEGRYHPLAAVYRTSCLPVIDRLLSADRLRPAYLFEQVPTRVIEASDLATVDPTFQSLRNLNSPEDYERALRDLAYGERGA